MMNNPFYGESALKLRWDTSFHIALMMNHEADPSKFGWVRDGYSARSIFPHAGIGMTGGDYLAPVSFDRLTKQRF
jgi:hypothetical protein